MLAGFQDAFVALAADADLRHRFRTDAKAALADFELTPREHAALVAIPLPALERYARSLVAKRWSEVSRVTPLTLRVAPGLGATYRAWAAITPARAIDTLLSPGVAEALRAHDAIRAALAHPAEASYAADLWSFEVLRAASRGDGEIRTFASRFAIQAIAAEVERGLLPIDPDLQPTTVRFVRPCELGTVSTPAHLRAP